MIFITACAHGSVTPVRTNCVWCSNNNFRCLIIITRKTTITVTAIFVKVKNFRQHILLSLEAGGLLLQCEILTIIDLVDVVFFFFLI